MAYSLFTGSYGLSNANFRVRILEVGTGTPAIIAKQDGTVINSEGETTIDAYGNLSVYLDNSKTFGIHLNQYQLASTDTTVATMVRRTAFQLSTLPTAVDIQLGPGALFYDPDVPTVYYRISTDHLSFQALTGNGSSAGTDGLNNSTLYLYQRSNSVPLTPTSSIIYTFATGMMTGITQGWSPTIPAGSSPLYVTSAVASARGSTQVVPPGEWASPVIFSENGINSASVYLFQRTSSPVPPSAPDVPVTYTFATGLATGIDNGWSQSLPTSGGSYRWQTGASALATSGTPSDVINPSEWSPVSLLAQDGSDGVSGLNNALVYAYQRAASTPAVPSATVTYTFASGITTGLDNGVTSTPPTGTLPIYVTVATAASLNPTDTITSAEWASPIIFAQNGTAGLNSSTVFLYKVTMTSATPSLPSAAVTYTFATSVATGVDNGWTQSLPTSGGGYRWITTASALSNTSTDVIPPSEWAPAALLSQDGDTGPQGLQGLQGNSGTNGLNNAIVFIYQRATSAPSLPSATVTYTFATAAITGLNNGWTSAVPTGSNPLYLASATASSSTSSDTIASNEWTTPVILAQDGTSAINAATVYLFQRTTTSTAPSVPSSSITYTFATGIATGITNGWSQTLVPIGGQYRWVITATALGTGTTDTVSSGEWSSPALLAQDGSPGAGTFTYITNANVTANGAIVTKTSGGNTYNGQAYSAQFYTGGAQMTMAVSGTDNIVAGLNSDPTSSGGSGYAGIDYAVTVGSHQMQIYESGVYKGNFGTVADGDILGIRYDNANVTYTLNGVLVKTTSATAGLKLALDTSFGVLNASTNFTFSAAGAAGANGAAGVNGANGARGSQTFYVTLSGSSSTWSDSLATSAASSNGGPIINDPVVESNSSVGFAQTRFWNGTSWVVVTQVLNGNLLVSGTVGAGALSANSVNTNNLVAQSITASKMVLADYTNLVFNGKGNSADGWTGVTSPPLAYSGASFWPSGSNSVFAIVFNDKDSYFGNQFPIVAGDQYYVAMDTYPLGGGASTYSFSIGMAFTDVNGNITTTVSGATRLAGTSGFQSIAGNVTVPTGYAYGVVWVQINGPASTTYVANGQVHYATNIQVRRMNGANLIVDGSISATKMVAQTITAAQISATAGITAGQIDARGLSIKDGSGNIILSAGVPLDFNNVGGTTKPANNATNDLVLVARGNCVLSGNTITKVGGAIAWDSDTYSKDSYTGGAYASVVPAGPFSTQAAMFGLNSDPTTDQSWTSLDYAFYTYVSGQLLIYESGVTTAYSGTWALGDVLVIAYDGVNVRYLKNGTVVRTVAAPSNLILFFDTSFSNPNSSYSNVRFGPLTSISTVTASAAAAATTATWSGVTGTGRPADNATSDISLIARGLAVVSGNTISKTSGSGSWDSDVYSLDSYVGGAYASGVVLTAAMSAMFGLNTDPLTDSSYFSIDYAIYTANDGGLYAYESGTGYNLSVPYVVGDVLAVTYDGVSVNYLQNGVVRRTVAAPAGLKLYFDSSINSAVNAFKNVRFGPLTSISTVTAAAAAAATTANWTGVSGTPGNLASLSGTEAIANADAATSLGFNPSFSAWTGTFPVGWSG